MPTRRLHREDPYLLEFDARVLARLDHDGRPAVVLDETAFYAESGGQPWDLGTLDAVPVLAVVEKGDEIVHVLEAPLAGDHVHGIVDGERRRDHRQQHHGQHLLSRALLELCGARTVSFHLGSEVSTIDLDRAVSDAQVESALRRTNDVVWEARPVRVRTTTRAEAEALGVAVPEEAGDAVRLVEAEGFDLQPCGGTHPRSTAEVGCVAVVGQERYKGASRVRFLCGHRALAAAREQGRILDRLTGLLSSSRADLPEAVQRLLDQAVATRKDVAGLMERTLRLEARQLFAKSLADSPAAMALASMPTPTTPTTAITTGSPTVVVARFDGRDPEELLGLAQAIVAEGPCVALLGTATGKAHLVFAQSPGVGRDVPALLKQAVALVGGRGGGRGDLARGGGDDVARLDEALAQAAAAARAKA
jgi:alanyl-tRNA synthetase